MNAVHSEMKEKVQKMLKIGDYEVPENVYKEGGIGNNVVNQIIYNAINFYNEESVSDCMYMLGRTLEHEELIPQVMHILEFCDNIHMDRVKKER